MRTKQLIQNDNFYIGGEGNTSAYLGTESVTSDGSGLYAWLCPSSSEGITVSLEVSAGTILNEVSGYSKDTFTDNNDLYESLKNIL